MFPNTKPSFGVRSCDFPELRGPISRPKPLPSPKLVTRDHAAPDLLAAPGPGTWSGEAISPGRRLFGRGGPLIHWSLWESLWWVYTPLQKKVDEFILYHMEIMGVDRPWKMVCLEGDWGDEGAIFHFQDCWKKIVFRILTHSLPFFSQWDGS